MDVLKRKNSNNKTERDAWLYNLRKNSVLTWVEELEEVLSYSRILNTSPINSTLEVESGIVRLEPNSQYIGHQFVPYVNAGFTFTEVCVLFKARIVEFESQYGKVELCESDISNLKQLVYQYNQQFSSVDMSDKKKLIHLEQSGELLHYLLIKSITLDIRVNGWCTLTFTKDNDTEKDYCTIFTEDQIALLKRVKDSILP